MNRKLQCPYCSSLKGYVYVQSHCQCLNCKRLVDDFYNGEIELCADIIHLNKKVDDN